MPRVSAGLFSGTGSRNTFPGGTSAVTSTSEPRPPAAFPSGYAAGDGISHPGPLLPTRWFRLTPFSIFEKISRRKAVSHFLWGRTLAHPGLSDRRQWRQGPIPSPCILNIS